MATVTELCPVYAPFFGTLVGISPFCDTTTDINEYCGYQGCTAAIVFTCASLPSVRSLFLWNNPNMLYYLFRLWSEVIIPNVIVLEVEADPRLHCR